REAGEVDSARQPELVEQVGVVEHQVVYVVQTLDVARLAVAGVERNEDAELRRPRFGELPAMERSSTVEKHERRGVRVAGGEDDGGRAVHVPRQPIERHRGNGAHAVTVFWVRRRGVTSSAKRVVFFTPFQLGMSPIVRLRFTRFDPASSIHRPTASATFSGVPATIRLMATRSSQLEVPWTSAAWMRLRNSGTVT